MKTYYNHLTDKMEKLEPYMAKNLPKSREEYQRRLLEKISPKLFAPIVPPIPEEPKKKRGRPKGSVKDYNDIYYYPTSPEAIKQGEEMYNEIMGEIKYTKFRSMEERKAYVAKIAKDYLNAHPEEIIKLRDEGLVQEMVDFAAKSAGISPLAVPAAPTEEEVYMAKREALGVPLTDSPAFKEEMEQLDNHFNHMSDEAQNRLVEAIQTVNNALHNHPHARAHKRPAGSDWDIDNKAYDDSKKRIKEAIQNEKDIRKDIRSGSTTYPMQNFDYSSAVNTSIDQAKEPIVEGWTKEKRDEFIKAWNNPDNWNTQYVAGIDALPDSTVNMAKVHHDGTVEYLNRKGETIKSVKTFNPPIFPEREPDYSKGEYHSSITEANSRTALVMMLTVFLVILAYLICM